MRKTQVLALLLAIVTLLPLCTPVRAAEDTEAPVETREAEQANKAPTTEQLRAVRFTDLPENKGLADSARYACCRGLLLGTGDGQFRPDMLLTRGQAVVVLGRLAAAVGAIAQPPANAMQWAIRTGILTGKEDGDYAEAEYVTRAQMATFLYRLADFAGLSTTCTGDLSAWRDGAAVAAYARAPLSWAAERHVLDAVAVDALLPDLPLSRIQLAAMATSLLADAEREPLAREFAAAAAQPAFHSVVRARHAEVQAQVNAVAKKYGAVGMQVAVIEKGHVTDSFAYGWATRQSDPMTADHRLRVASISKVVIGMDAMRLRENGTITLEAPIGTYWGENFRNPYYTGKAVNISGILTHTSSIAMLEGDSAYSGSAVRQRQRGSSGYSHTTPGALSSWGYNNYAFCVLGLTLELAEKQTMDQMLHHYFFDALGIDAGFNAGDLASQNRIAALYNHSGGVDRSIATQRGYHAGAPGAKGSAFAGGLTISANDLAKMFAVLASDGVYEGVRLLSADSVAQMESHADTRVSDGFYQAMPLRCRSAYGRDTLYYHTGSGYGVYNCASYDPVTGDGVIVLTTGASAARDSNGIYAVCGGIADYIYRMIER
ncbi:MAG: serine hydrolase [Oscillospiraceae bacterium]|nr:serine hydrolase [Oscillospiraceae bacterium]